MRSTQLAWQIWWPAALAMILGTLVALLGLSVARERSVRWTARQGLDRAFHHAESDWSSTSGGTLSAHLEAFSVRVGAWLPDDLRVAVISDAGQPLIAIPASARTLHFDPPLGLDSDEFTIQRRMASLDPRSLWLRVSAMRPTGHSATAAYHGWLWSAGGAGLIVALAAWSWLLERRLRPVQLLAQTAAQMVERTPGESVSFAAHNELRDIALALNVLRGRLAHGESRLQERGVQQETVLSAMTDGVLAVDRDRDLILFANRSVQHLLNLPRPAEIGRPLLESVRVHKIHQLVTYALHSGSSQQDEMQLDTIPPRTLNVRVTCMPGRPCPGVVVVLHDISELRRLEQLRHEFVANVSHELKTPLSSIKAYAETLRRGAIRDEANCDRFLSRIEEHADRLDALIGDLLSLTRIESGQKSYELQAVSVAEAIAMCLNDHQAAARAKSIELAIDGDMPPMSVRADEEGLRQILDNLVNNAIRYTGHHGRVALRWFRSGDDVAIEVQDTGLGIAEEDQKRVFERFYRVDKARSRELGGTGLGLAIVKHLAQFFGGRVYVRSQVNVGSTFGVQLPRAPSPRSEEGGA